MSLIADLVRQTEEERNRVLEFASRFTPEQAAYKPAPDVWSVNENLEHLVLAEVSGVSKIWAAAEGIRRSKPVWSGEHTNRGLPIKEVIARTWKPKEMAPPIATPHIGGPLSYCMAMLRSSQAILDQLEPVLSGLDPEAVVFPHFLCGPLDSGQRVDFLRFHIARHARQMEELTGRSDFPRT